MNSGKLFVTTGVGATLSALERSLKLMEKIKIHHEFVCQ